MPFGCGASRAQFSTVRTNNLSGPGSYERDPLQITKPTPVKGIELRTALKHQMVTAQQSPMFKSRQPKISIYEFDEKRLRLLHGERPNAQFKVKLNDEIIDEHTKRRAHQSPRARLKVGLTVAPTEQQQKEQQRHEQLKDVQNYVFATHKKLPLGPGHYQTKDSLTHAKSPEPSFAAKQVRPAALKAKEERERRLFDGSGATIKDRRRNVADCPTTEACIEVTEFDANAQPRAAVFNSEAERFERERSRSLGPAAYVNNAEPVYAMKGVSSGAFNSTAARGDLLQRNVSRSPFKNPTKCESPSPDRYNTQTKANHTSFPGGTKFGSQQSYSGNGESAKDLTKFNPDQKSDSMFVSQLPRDNLASVSKDALSSPGPGAYIPLDSLAKTGQKI